MPQIVSDRAASGAAFLFEATSARGIFTPERLTDEHRLVGRTATEFVTREVLPEQEALEADPQRNVDLLRRAGALGLLAVDVDEAYGGLGLDKVTSTVVAEAIGATMAFSVSHAAHCTIGTLPIVFFGTDAQKDRYLPRLATGEIIAAYALTEPEAGSDALSARTTATLSDDGREWILSGSKMWITNAGFADLFTVFAKVDGREFSAFLVERGAPGLSFGAEEHKMGIKGSSTRAVILDRVRVPVESLLGERGQGHRIALNILNIGRYKLAAGCLGAARTVLSHAASYAEDRRQFGRPIASFGAIREKLARMATTIWQVETALYRTAGLIDEALAGAADARARLRAIEEYAIECAMLKVLGSEALGFVADEGVQIFGGNGYSQEYPVERYYRDARINRIFEGTNEINRLLVPTMLLRRRATGGISGGASAHADVVATQDDAEKARSLASPQFVAGLKQLAVRSLAHAEERFGTSVGEQQEVLLRLADLVMQVYLADSALTRAGQAEGASAEAQRDLAAVTIHDAAAAMRTIARELEDATGPATAPDADVLCRHAPFSVIDARRRIAECVLAWSRLQAPGYWPPAAHGWRQAAPLA